jgi:hypothetical protein
MSFGFKALSPESVGKRDAISSIPLSLAERG